MSVSYGGDSITFADNSTISSGWTGFKNRVINGAMAIDQRNSGNPANTGTYIYSTDRFFFANQTDGAINCQRVSDAPTGSGLQYSNKVTITTADTSLSTSQRLVLNHGIEGLNVADLMWGTAYAKTVTVSFWVKASIAGTYSFSIRTGNAGTSYLSSYTILATNTWEQKTITIPGPTFGTWLTDNNASMYLIWNLGIGSDYNISSEGWSSSTNGQGSTSHTKLIGTLNATWQITGVQFEVGSTASSFEYRPYPTELALCQRYYYKKINESAGGSIDSLGIPTAYNGSTSNQWLMYWHPVEMRSYPTYSNGTGYYGGSPASVRGGLRWLSMNFTTGSYYLQGTTTFEVSAEI